MIPPCSSDSGVEKHPFPYQCDVVVVALSISSRDDRVVVMVVDDDVVVPVAPRPDHDNRIHKMSRRPVSWGK